MARTHRVAVLALDGVYPFELGMPSRIFGAAEGRYEVLTCAATRQWALERLHEPLVLADLAQHARRFTDEVGMSPGRWLVKQRVARARHLLESSDLPVDEIAGHVGFATGTSLRQHLNAAIGVAPLAYRRTFRAER